MPPEFAIIREYDEDDRKVVVVDTEEATYQGRKWPKLDRYFRRKFENLVVLSRPKDGIKVFYQLPWGMFYDRESAASKYYYKYGY